MFKKKLDYSINKRIWKRNLNFKLEFPKNGKLMINGLIFIGLLYKVLNSADSLVIRLI